MHHKKVVKAPITKRLVHCEGLLHPRRVLQNSSTGSREASSTVVLITVRKSLTPLFHKWISGALISVHNCFVETSFFFHTFTLVRLFYLSGLFTGCLELGLLAGLFDLLVLGQTVGVLSGHRVFLLPQDLSARHKEEWEEKSSSVNRRVQGFIFAAKLLKYHWTKTVAFKFSLLEEYFLLFFILSQRCVLLMLKASEWIDYVASVFARRSGHSAQLQAVWPRLGNTFNCPATFSSATTRTGRVSAEAVPASPPPPHPPIPSCIPNNSLPTWPGCSWPTDRETATT